MGTERKGVVNDCQDEWVTITMDGTAGWRICEDPVMGVTAAPISAASTWEGAGPQPKDAPAGPCLETVLKDWADALLYEAQGAQMASAVTALHAQRSTDGRPRVFLPDLED